MLLFLAGSLLHMPLALLMRWVPVWATIHALLILGLGLYFALRDRTPLRFIYLTGYIMAAEVLWRMTRAAVFWEYGKYLLVLLFLVVILRYRIRPHALPIFYFVPLLPSILLTLTELPWSEARGEISFNLAGHLTLMIAAFFFHQVRFRRSELRRLLLSALLPLIGISFLVLVTLLLSEVDFFPSSNIGTSGGFGPNQISAVLGLGALLCWLFTITAPKLGRFEWLVMALGLGLLLQAILTFSRGGVFNVLVAAPLATIFLTWGRIRTSRIAIIGLLGVGFLAYVALPGLNAYTGGSLQTRFQDLNLTGRDLIWQADLQTWQENPLTGVGPGLAKGYRQTLLGEAFAAHTEYSRLLAEHGMLGLWAMIILAFIFARAVASAESNFERGLVVAMTLWALAEMTHSAMRIVAIPYLIALTFARMALDD
jgi:O-antigen ligase